MGRKRVDPDKRKYKDPAERREQIKAEAFKIAADKGLGSVTIAGVARAIGVTGPLINRYMGTLGELQQAVIAQAVKVREVEIVADAIEMKLEFEAPPELRNAAAQLLAAA